MTNPGSPTLARWMLSAELTRLREKAGASQDQAAAVIGSSPRKMSHLESGRNVPGYLELPALLALYGASEQLEQLEQLRRAGNQRGWWSSLQLRPVERTYFGLESAATKINVFTLELVPGLLQTEGYAYDSHSQHGITGEDAKDGVTVRLRRQERVGGGLVVQAVISESLLHRTQHMGQIGVEQLRSLAVAAAKGVSGVEVRVLPDAAGSHPSRNGSFTLLTFPPGTLGRVAYQEYSVGAHLVDDPAAVSELEQIYRRLQQQSLSKRDSVQLLSRYVKDAEELLA